MAFEKPLFVVALDESPDDLASLLQRFEVMQVQTLLFQRAHPTLDDTVALWLAHVAWRRADPEPVQLTEKLMGRVLRPPVVTQTETQGDRSGVTAEMLADTLPNRLQGGPAISLLGHMPADDVLAEVIDRAEEPAPAVLSSIEARRVGAPQLVRLLGHDRSAVGPIAVDVTPAMRSEKTMLAHQTQYSVLADTDSTRSKSDSDLAMTFPSVPTSVRHFPF